MFSRVQHSSLFLQRRKKKFCKSETKSTNANHTIKNVEIRTNSFNGAVQLVRLDTVWTTKTQFGSFEQIQGNISPNLAPLKNAFKNFEV